MEDDDEQIALDELSRRFLAALAAKEAGRIDEAEEALRRVLRVEPRLPEPRIELARILLDTDRLDEAEEEAREGLAQLEISGPWSEDLEPDVVAALGKALLAECLRRQAEEDDVVFGDPERFRAIVSEARALFAEAARLDPSDEYASYHAFFLGTGKRQTDDADDDAELGDGDPLKP
jgi:tetratricopeptide (TPR) repeat protein